MTLTNSSRTDTRQVAATLTCSKVGISDLMSCHAISVLNLILAQTILCFTLHSRGIHSSVKFCDTLLPSRHRPVKYCEWAACQSKQKILETVESDWWAGFCCCLFFFELPPIGFIQHSTLSYPKSFKLWSATPPVSWSPSSCLFIPIFANRYLTW